MTRSDLRRLGSAPRSSWPALVAGVRPRRAGGRRRSDVDSSRSARSTPSIRRRPSSSTSTPATGQGAGQLTQRRRAVTADTRAAAADEHAVRHRLVLDTSSGRWTSGALVDQGRAQALDPASSPAGRARRAVRASTPPSDAGVHRPGLHRPTPASSSPPSTRSLRPAAEAHDKTALWSAVRQAAAGLSSNSDLSPNSLIMSGAGRQRQRQPARRRAIGEIASANTPVFGLAYTGGGYNGGALDVAGADLRRPAARPPTRAVRWATWWLRRRPPSTHSQYTVTYASTAEASRCADLEPQRRRPDGDAVLHAGPGPRRASELAPAAGRQAAASRCSAGRLGLLLAVLRCCVGGGAGGLRHLPAGHQGRTASTACSQPYSEGYGPQDDLDDEDDASFAKTAIIQRAGRGHRAVRRAPGLPEPGRGRARAGQPARCAPARRCSSTPPVVVVATILRPRPRRPVRRR